MNLFSIRRLIPAALGALALSAAPAWAVPVVQDSFSDGTRENGTDPLDTPFFVAVAPATSLTVVDDTAGIGSGNALSFTTSGTFQRFVGVFNTTPATLNPGDTLTLSFNYRFLTEPASAGGGFRFGLFNDGGTPQTGDTNNVGPRADDAGYVVSTNPGANTTNGTNINEEAAGTTNTTNPNDDILGGPGTSTTVGFGSGGGSLASGTTPHTATLSITRNAAGDALSFSGRLDNANAFSGTDTTPLTFTFNEFALGFGNTDLDVRIDNVTVDVVPEPGGAAVLAAAAGLLAVRRRRVPAATLA